MPVAIEAKRITRPPFHGEQKRDKDRTTGQNVLSRVAEYRKTVGREENERINAALRFVGVSDSALTILRGTSQEATDVEKRNAVKAVVLQAAELFAHEVAPVSDRRVNRKPSGDAGEIYLKRSFTVDAREIDELGRHSVAIDLIQGPATVGADHAITVDQTAFRSPGWFRVDARASLKISRIEVGYTDITKVQDDLRLDKKAPFITVDGTNVESVQAGIANGWPKAFEVGLFRGQYGNRAVTLYTRGPITTHDITHAAKTAQLNEQTTGNVTYIEAGKSGERFYPVAPNGWRIAGIDHAWQVDQKEKHLHIDAKVVAMSDADRQIYNTLTTAGKRKAMRAQLTAADTAGAQLGLYREGVKFQLPVVVGEHDRELANITWDSTQSAQIREIQRAEERDVLALRTAELETVDVLKFNTGIIAAAYTDLTPGDADVRVDILEAVFKNMKAQARMGSAEFRATLTASEDSEQKALFEAAFQQSAKAGKHPEVLLEALTFRLMQPDPAEFEQATNAARDAIFAAGVTRTAGEAFEFNPGVVEAEWKKFRNLVRAVDQTVTDDEMNAVRTAWRNAIEIGDARGLFLLQSFRAVEAQPTSEEPDINSPAARNLMAALSLFPRSDALIEAAILSGNPYTTLQPFTYGYPPGYPVAPGERPPRRRPEDRLRRGGDEE